SVAIERENALKIQRDEAIEELKFAISQIPAQQAMIETRKKLNELRSKAMSDAQRKAVTGRR
ncbi:MAG TPA: hypothetical protein VKA27_01400, partial [Sunxiuqinia sp.]|nr:hypothetical protein [Sunxiuqinia sp.]